MRKYNELGRTHEVLHQIRRTSRNPESIAKIEARIVEHHGGTGDLDNLTPEELRAELAREYELSGAHITDMERDEHGNPTPESVERAKAVAEHKAFHDRRIKDIQRKIARYRY